MYKLVSDSGLVGAGQAAKLVRVEQLSQLSAAKFIVTDWGR